MNRECCGGNPSFSKVHDIYGPVKIFRYARNKEGGEREKRIEEEGEEEEEEPRNREYSRIQRG